MYHRSGALARSLANPKARSEAADTFVWHRRRASAGVDFQELRARAESIGAGVRLTLVICAAGWLYVAATWDRPDRQLIASLFGLGRDRGAAVRADPARARRAQPLARAVLPAVEHDPDRAHGRGRGRRRRVDEPAGAAVLHPGGLRGAVVPARLGGHDRGARLRRLRGGRGRRGAPGPRVRRLLRALPRMHRRAVRLARPQPGPPPRGARARVARGSPDRVPQPPRLRGALRRRAEPRGAQRPPGRADHARPRPLQGGQRHARPRAPATRCCAGPWR